MLNVPIGFDGVTWGVLEVDSERPGHFHDTDVEFLEAMATLLAGALLGGARVLTSRGRA